ncbi:molybdate ABC transporter substrate-binding protein [Tautonia marina]|uniref:molybdate ABC transporter substrate-binding protein n=1 Tax=Tautonia marina TaxID=2653855 RepID=UPI0013756AC1|nr:molybdate ABC transporter substrate-binding protein [Tautonia marina]
MRCRSDAGHRGRWGRISSLWGLVLGAVALIAALIGLLWMGGPGEEPAADRITMFCAAGLREPVERVARAYTDETGVEVDLQYGGSNTLLNQIEINKFDSADLYLAGDDFYTQEAVDRGLAAEVLPIAEMRLVVVVREGNPKGVESFDDLLRDDLTVSMPSPDQAAVGRAVRQVLEGQADGEGTRWDRLEEQVTRSGVFKPTVNDVANDVKVGAADVGIVWDFTAKASGYRDDLDPISLPELDGPPNLVSVAVLHASRQPTAALKFARYLTARDRGLPVFKEAGLQPVEGDVWADRPQITFFCGAVNRKAVETIVQEFAAREGVEVNTIYDGCGILTGRMKTIDDQRTDLGFPDIYMACDEYYLENVKEWFQDAASVSSTEIVIVVPKGNTKVSTLDNLLEPGVRVAVGQPDQCTIGALTRRLLAREGLYDRLKEKQGQPGEVVVEKSSSALLVPDVVTGHVDAAIAYHCDTLASQDAIDVVRIDSTLNQAIQPLSIARNSDHKALSRRLYNRVTSSPEAFTAAGFEFLLNRPSPIATTPEAEDAARVD